jgi:hypothetical protein
MKYFLLLVTLSLLGCSPSWQESPYEVYYIDGSKALGYHLDEGTYIGRIDDPKQIASNDSYLSVYACPDGICAFYYIDKVKDHKFADHDEFVFGPYTKQAFLDVQRVLSLPQLDIE